jgi:hypothetical protein
MATATYHLHVKAKDEQGNPLAGVAIRLQLWSENQPPVEDRLLETDAEGERSWSSTVATRPTYWLMEFEKPGYRPDAEFGLITWAEELSGGVVTHYAGTIPDLEVTLRLDGPAAGGA